MHPRAHLQAPLLTVAFALAVAASPAHAETTPAPAKAAVSPWKAATTRPGTASVQVVPPAPATVTTDAGAPVGAAATKHAVPRSRRTATTHAGAPARATAATPANASAAGTAKTPRRLEDVSIEGEVPVPQVLFVTAREQRRGIEFQQHRYLPTARALGQATPLPRWIATPQNPPPSR